MTTAGQRKPHDQVLRLLYRALIGAALLLAMLLAGVQLARATEIVPAVGITRA